ncbi:hypothetical protein [Streptomyces cyaneofuscatus]|uniref:hypothetical protein n=1 Tax=Streptomyces cyaneofuscatus TaxID=66883 RepID=UPI00365C7E00
MDGAWVDRKQPYVWREVERYGLGVVADPAPTLAFLPTSTGFGEFSPADAFARQAELITPLFDAPSSVPPSRITGRTWYGRSTGCPCGTSWTRCTTPRTTNCSSVTPWAA